MSLINEALKKAQRTRDPRGPGESTTSGAEFLGERVPRRGERQPKNTMLVVLATIGACSLAAAAVYLFTVDRGRSEQVVTAPPAATLTISSEQATPPPAEPTVTVSLGGAAADVTSTPAAAKDTSARAAPPPPVITAAPAAAIPVITAASEPAPAAPPVTIVPAVPERRQVPSTPTRDPEVVDFIERLRITGVRASSTDPKVLMNDRVYRHQDVVNRALGLRLTRITDSELTFVDESGYVYTRSF